MPSDFTTVSVCNSSQTHVNVTSICAGHSLRSQYGGGGAGVGGRLITATPSPFHFILREELEARDGVIHQKKPSKPGRKLRFLALWLEEFDIVLPQHPNCG